MERAGHEREIRDTNNSFESLGCKRRKSAIGFCFVFQMGEMEKV